MLMKTLREGLMEEWWEEELGERPVLNRHGTCEGWDNVSYCERRDPRKF